MRARSAPPIARRPLGSRALRFALGLALLVAAIPARAHVVSDLEVGVLQKLPRGMLAHLATADVPDATGAVGENREHWRHVGAQAPALRLLADASARRDSLAAERAWRAIDLAFAHQTPGGGFAHVPAASYRDSLEEVLGTARWAAATCRAFVVVMNGPMQNAFRMRYVLTLRKLEATLHWLEARIPELELAHVKHGPELLVLAQTFLLGDGTFHVESFGRIGQRCLAKALALQRRDGAFPRDADVALDAQAGALESLESVAQYFPTPMLERGTDLVAGWLAKQISATGALPRTATPAEQRHVLAALAYHAERRDDATLRHLVARAFARLPRTR
jgi:hypothetical protein